MNVISVISVICVCFANLAAVEAQHAMAVASLTTPSTDRFVKASRAAYSCIGQNIIGAIFK